MFGDDGQPVIYGGPVGLKTNSFTHVVEVKPRVFALPDTQSVLDTDASAVEELIKAANLDCEKTGYTRIGTAAGIHSTDDTILLVRHCVPAGTEIFADAKVGDDIQILLRAIRIFAAIRALNDKIICPFASLGNHRKSVRLKIQ